jgi:hypothetical protein
MLLSKPEANPRVGANPLTLKPQLIQNPNY